MNDRAVSHRITAARFIRAIKIFATSEVGGKARWMLAGLVAFLLAINGMNVVNSFVGRDFMTAIAERNRPEFILQAVFYIGVFAVSTLLSVSSRFTEERLGLLWRDFLTGRAIGLYLADGTYYRLETSQHLTNPDQRITEDIRAFTVTTLSFVLMVLNSSFTIVSFSGVLWSISPALLLVAVVYAAGGSLVTVLLGRPLIKLNYDQLDKEANFRSGLIHVRESAEAIRIAGAEARNEQRLRERLADLVRNFRRIVRVNRNLGFFTTGYNWLIQIIPALIIAPAYMAGQVEFGVITQSAMAFSTLVAAFSLIVTQFQSISSFAAVVERLNLLSSAVEDFTAGSGSAIVVRESSGPLAFEGLSLSSPEDGRVLIRNLSLSIPEGSRVLIRGADESATLALFRATAGLNGVGEGVLIRPKREDLIYLAERPYLPPGTLRAAMVPPPKDGAIADERLVELLEEWHLGPILARAGGLHADQDWPALLSLGEQQLLACLRAILAAPRFVLFDRPGTALGPDRLATVLARFRSAGIGYLHFAHHTDPIDSYDAVLDIAADGRWSWKTDGRQGRVEGEPEGAARPL